MKIGKITSSRLAPIKHGFYTRQGGYSSGIFKGLNCGLGSSDNLMLVAKNKELVANDLGLSVETLINLSQTHSATAVRVNTYSSESLEADAVITSTPKLGLSVLTADCQPVLFADHKEQIIAAAHAGWRGTLEGILEATIEQMEYLGAKRENIHAVIGPCISQTAYEVGQEFFEQFSDTDSSYAVFFNKNAKPNKYFFDLPSFGLHRLRNAGVNNSAWVQECTYSTPNKYYSYRRKTHRSEEDYGRLISVIRL